MRHLGGVVVKQTLAHQGWHVSFKSHLCHSASCLPTWAMIGCSLGWDLRELNYNLYRLTENLCIRLMLSDNQNVALSTRSLSIYEPCLRGWKDAVTKCSNIRVKMYKMCQIKTSLCYLNSFCYKCSNLIARFFHQNKVLLNNSVID